MTIDTVKEQGVERSLIKLSQMRSAQCYVIIVVYVY